MVGISYGGFVAYSMAAQFKERIERLVLCCAGVCMEEKDMDEGMFKVKSVDEAVSVLLPQTPAKMKDLLRFAFHKPLKGVPTCFLNDFIEVLKLLSTHDHMLCLCLFCFAIFCVAWDFKWLLVVDQLV